ncbi:MAG: hypothetical protein JOZ69_01715 [Myxococcales bacterium]|nr:hypothetical protein [Myxococcales bacterium]
MVGRRRGTRRAHRFLTASALASVVLSSSSRGAAENVFFRRGPWEAFTDGQFGAFVSYVHGDGLARPTYAVRKDGSSIVVHDVSGGGWSYASERQILPGQPGPNPTLVDQGTVDLWRVRSGSLGNLLGLGVRGRINATMRVSGYVQFVTFVESDNQQITRASFADVRTGYAKIEGPWGSVLAGRTRTLFSKGATDIDVLYAHRWGVGFPNVIDANGAGGVYATPDVAGFQLSVGVFDPFQPPTGAWFRTKYLRPEFELTFERGIGSSGKIALFVNGGIEDVYKDGYCAPPSPANPLPCSATLFGFGSGGRFEIGPVHLGVAALTASGLEPNYPLQITDASVDPQGNLRTLAAYIAQGQAALGRLDVFAGGSVTRVFLTPADRQTVIDPRDPSGGAHVVPHSVIKYQVGVNGGVVYHLAPSLHLDVDYFRAEADWYLGERQVIHVLNGGMTVSW